jgi:cell division protein FtsW
VTTLDSRPQQIGLLSVPARSIRANLGRPLATYYLLVGATLMLLVLGLIMVLSASSVFSFEESGDSYAIVKRQLLWVAIGLPCAALASLIPLSVVRRFAWLGLILAVVLVSLTHTALGEERNNQTNWLSVGPLLMQPSELAKLAMVIWAAHIFAVKEKHLDNLSHLLIPVVPGLLLVIALVALNDLGTGLVLLLIMLALLWVVGTPLKLFGVGLSAVSVLALVLAASNKEALSRLTSFTDPFAHYQGSGWQPAHGLFALAQGGLFGEGIGASMQKWGRLPYPHTDYIFAVIGEELGLVGTLLVLGLFLTIAYCGIRVAHHTTDPFVRYAAFGFVAWLVGQAMLNIGMVLALLPVIGLPLPLLSYGGSAMVWTLMALGLLIGFARREPECAAALAARRNKAAAL